MLPQNKIQKVHPRNDLKEPPVYYVTFENYLQPKKINRKTKPLLVNDQTDGQSRFRVKLLEHPVLVAGRKPKWRIFQEKLKRLLEKPGKVHTTPIKPETTNQEPPSGQENELVRPFALRWYKKVREKRTASIFGSLKLPKFLAFLRARNDDGLCKRKSGFEIYCEMASIHGFINFVGSTTAQRAFWCFVIFVAIAMSGFILLLSHLMNSSTPTILYTESTQHPTWPIPFPAVTICNVNRISKSKAKIMAEKLHHNSNLTVPQLLHLFRLVVYPTENIEVHPEEFQILHQVLERNRISFNELQNKLTPDCEPSLLRCKWKGRFEICKQFFEQIPTSTGLCCSFNAHALKDHDQQRANSQFDDDVEYTTSCGPETGLSVLINPDLEDYQLSTRKTPGLQVYIHDAHDFTDTNVMQSVIIPRSVNYIGVTPQQTHATEYINSLNLRSRRCYLANERKLFYFRFYSQVNCLAECRSTMLYEKCRCTLSQWPRKANWTVCGLRESECVLKNKDIFRSTLKSTRIHDRHYYYTENFVCDCYPSCDFNMYTVSEDSGKLVRQFSMTDKRFFKSINITNHILLHVFYDGLNAERLRRDVYENWLSFIGTFGGITGLHMGYSFVSGFEMIFFVFVRPACNWMTRKQIRYRIKRRQQKAEAEAEKKRKMEEEREKQERIEAFLRMRPYCPGY